MFHSVNSLEVNSTNKKNCHRGFFLWATEFCPQTWKLEKHPLLAEVKVFSC